MIPIPQRAWARVLAAGCAWWLALVLLRTEKMAATIGVSASEVRALGVRDLGNGLALALAPDPRPHIAMRAAFDVADSVRYGRGRPAVRAMTLGFAALGALGLLAKRP